MSEGCKFVHQVGGSICHTLLAILHGPDYINYNYMAHNIVMTSMEFSKS